MRIGRIHYAVQHANAHCGDATPRTCLPYSRLRYACQSMLPCSVMSAIW
ncbi:hypothetical protein XCR_4442 [Xanthomonas campestris pv. raphani 756C]|nr:hypothetical protein XCR_4442 [Xanthomonas campestris pv. raphani 756C]